MRRNIYASLGAQWVSAALNMVGSVLIARMMQPTELGVFTVTMAMIGLLGTLQMAGASEFLLYAKSVDLATRRAVFGLTVLITALLCLFLLLGGPILSWIYGNDGVARVARIAALQMGLSTALAPVGAMLRRAERFQVLSVIQLVQNLVLTGTSLFLVWAGWSYMGLAYGSVLGTVVGVALTAWLGREYLLFVPAFAGMRGVAGGTVKYFLGNVVTAVQVQTPPMLIGAITSVALAGLFGRANMIASIYSQTIARAVDPLINARIAAESRTGTGSRTIMVASSRMMLTISVGFFGFVVLTAHLLVPLIFGEQWSAAAPAMRALAIGHAIWPLPAPVTAMLLAAERPGVVVRIRAVNVVALIGAILLMAPFGLEAVAWGISAISYLFLIQALHAAHRYAGLELGPYLRQLVGSLAAALVPLAASGVALAALTAAGLSGWSLLFATGGVMALTGAAALVAFDHPLWHEVKFLIGRRRAAA